MGHVASKKLSNPITGDWRRKLDKGSIDKKSPTDEKNEDKNGKIIKCRYCRWKNLLTWTKNREGKTEIDRERGDVVWSMKDLDNKGLGW